MGCVLPGGSCCFNSGLHSNAGAVYLYASAIGKQWGVIKLLPQVKMKRRFGRCLCAGAMSFVCVGLVKTKKIMSLQPLEDDETEDLTQGRVDWNRKHFRVRVMEGK